jgi:putative transcriptional regulator
MNTIKAIRERLGVTQAELAKKMGCTQGNVGHYERGQTVPPDAAKRLIDYAGSLGHTITFNDIYMPELAQAPASPAQAATETIAIDRGQVHDGRHEAVVPASVAVCQTAVQGV